MFKVLIIGIYGIIRYSYAACFVVYIMFVMVFLGFLSIIIEEVCLGWVRFLKREKYSRINRRFFYSTDIDYNYDNVADSADKFLYNFFTTFNFSCVKLIHNKLSYRLFFMRNFKFYNYQI